MSWPINNNIGQSMTWLDSELICEKIAWLLLVNSCCRLDVSQTSQVPKMFEGKFGVNNHSKCDFLKSVIELTSSWLDWLRVCLSANCPVIDVAAFVASRHDTLWHCTVHKLFSVVWCNEWFICKFIHKCVHVCGFVMQRWKIWSHHWECCQWLY